MRSTVLAVMAALVVTGCATKREMTMVPAQSGADVGVRFSRGEALMVSGGDRGAVMIAPVRYNGASKRLMFRVAAFNRSGEPVNFGAENVTIEMDNGTFLPVHNFDMLRSGAKAQARQQQMAALIEAGIGIYAASQVNNDNPYVAGRMAEATAAVYDYRMYSIAANLAYTMGTMGRYVLQTSTIDPRTYWGGAILADQPDLPKAEAQRVRVSVNLAGEMHYFHLSLTQEGAPVQHVVNLPALWRRDMEAYRDTPQTWLYDEPPVVVESWPPQCRATVTETGRIIPIGVCSAPPRALR